MHQKQQVFLPVISMNCWGTSKEKKAAFAAVFISVILLCLTRTTTVHAQTAADGEIKIMFLVFNDMADLYIKFAYGAMVLIFAVGIVKSGLSAQVAKQFGAPGRVSGELINLLGGIVVFVVGILTFPLAQEIIKTVTSETGVTSAPTTGNLKLPGIN